MIAFFGVVLVVLSNTTDPNTGMDEWAALAAKEGEEEPEALQTIRSESHSRVLFETGRIGVVEACDEVISTFRKVFFFFVDG